MKIFLDTANLESIKKYNDIGIVDGITTNPTLIFKEKIPPHDLMKKIVEMVNGPVSLEVVSTETESMLVEADNLIKFGENVVVKIPMTAQGLHAVKILNERNVSTNVTLVFSANQALLAAKAGASYVSPFIGRIDDSGHDGMNLIREIKQIFVNYGFHTKILVASIRHPIHVVEAAKIGSDVVTLPPDILGKMISHPLTDKGLDLFLSDWEKVKKSFNL